jgi:nucleoside-diphosphate-sugar epimerase
MKVLVTGASSHLARVLLPKLLAHPDVERVTGLDWRVNRFSHPHYRHVLMDTRAAEVGKIMEGADAVVHLAWVVMQRDLGQRRHDREWVRSINVDGTANVVQRALAQNVPRLIHLSSAAIYDLATPYKGAIPESHPRRALAGFADGIEARAARQGSRGCGFAYGEDQVVIEDWLDSFEADHPEMQIIRLRPHVIVGRQAQPYINYLLRNAVYPVLPDPQPLLQCVHEDDVVQAIECALTTEARGAFNLAPSDSLSIRDLKLFLHRTPIRLSLATARALITTLWRLFRVGTDPAWLQNIHYNLVLHSRRARKELGWQPRYDTVQECLATLVRPRKSHG